jgi:hypothetical protein
MTLNDEESEVIRNDDGTYERWYDSGEHFVLFIAPTQEHP